MVPGGSGWFGRQFCTHIENHQIPYRAIGRRDVNLYDVGELTSLLARLAPSFVINCAGYTGSPNVDACETYRTECLAANAALPGHVAQACEMLGTPWGHMSSGCIYTGTDSLDKGFAECDPPNFTFRQNHCSFYTGCKALAEETLYRYSSGYFWRIRMPFNHVDSPKNYISKLLRYDRLLEARNSLSCIPEVVEGCLQCWMDALPFGTYHLTNTGSVTTSDVAAMIREHGLTTKAFHYFRNEQEFLQQVEAPRSICVLDNSKALEAGLKLSPVREALNRSIMNWQSSRSKLPCVA